MMNSIRCLKKHKKNGVNIVLFISTFNRGVEEKGLHFGDADITSHTKIIKRNVE